MNRMIALLALTSTLAACGADPVPREVTAEDPEIARIAAQSNQFTLDVMEAADVDAPNVFLSPFSMNAALSMVYAGARGDTAAELESVLHIDPEADHHGPTGRYLRDLSGDKNRDYTLRTANRVWVRQGEVLEQSFLDITENDYGAPTIEADMAGDAEGVRTEVNDWVSEQTEDRIEDLLPPGSVSAATVMILANAIYFKADWAQTFDKSRTAPADFSTLSGETVSVDMMNDTFDVHRAAGEDFEVAGLAYGEDADLRLWVVLPNEGIELSAVEADLDAESLSTVLDSAEQRESTISLPKLELKTELQLKPMLSELGMPTAFSGEADFSGIRASGGLYIDEAYHQAFVLMDEEGTEAAAATAVVMNESAAIDTDVFTVDRPYLFLIRDELTGAFLFAGRVGDPSAAASGIE